MLLKKRWRSNAVPFMCAPRSSQLPKAFRSRLRKVWAGKGAGRIHERALRADLLEIPPGRCGDDQITRRMESQKIMSQRAQFKPPIEPLQKAFERAMEAIDRGCEGTAVFMVAGRVRATKKGSPSFERNLRRLRNNVVGVYDLGADARHVRDDLAEFYRDAA